MHADEKSSRLVGLAVRVLRQTNADCRCVISPSAGRRMPVSPRAPPAPSSIAIAHRHCHRWEPAETHSRRTNRLPRLPRRRQLPARLACPALHGKGERIAIAIGRAPFSAPHWQRDPAPTANHPPRARSHPSHWQHLRSTRLQAPRPEPDCREPQLRQRRSRSIVRRRRLRRPAVAWLGAGGAEALHAGAERQPVLRPHCDFAVSALCAHRPRDAPGKHR
jgi:hypothetical protein